MLDVVKTYLIRFSEIFYPNLCLICWKETPINGRKLCVPCLAEMPYTDHFEYNNNRITKKFRGRFPISYGGSLINFYKGSQFTDMLHRFKYEGVKEIGHMLGKMTGHRLKRSNWYQEIDIIIPVPIHPARRAKRGYNQSAEFAQGLKEIINVPVVENLLIKSIHTSSQTDKGRVERINNVLGTFAVTDIHRYQGRHFLLVDDVITTGATIEACAIALANIPNCKISVVSIAVARL